MASTSRGKIYYLPVSYEVEHRNVRDKLQGSIWGKKAEIVFCTVIILLAAAIIPVMVIWAVHQLAAMGV